VEEGRRSSFAPAESRAAVRSRIVESELDMVRKESGPSILFSRIGRLLRWLMPDARAVGQPMRSVARELEEAFPSRDN